MKSFFKLTSAIFFLFVINLTAQDTLTILHVNDTHSMLAPMGPRLDNLKGTKGGIARAASVIIETKKTEPNVLALHGGDAFVGDLFFNSFFGISEFQLMNYLGFDAMVVGNHEFDLGPGILQTAFDSSLGIVNGGFSVVSSNIILEDSAVSPLKRYIKPYIVKEIGKIKVGIFGLTTPAANYQSLPAPAVIDTNIEACITQALTSLVTEGCNLIIGISHLGTYYDRQIAASVPGINVIISAHDHSETVNPIEVINPITNKTTYVVEAGAFYSNVGKLKLVINGSEVSKLEYQLISLDKNITEDPTVAEIVDRLIGRIESEYGIHFYTQTCGFALKDFDEVAELPITDSDSTGVGRLVTNALRWKTNTQIAITVGGLTSLPIYKGPIVPADLYRAIGYGFNEINKLGYRVMTFNIKGSDLFAALEMCLSQTELDDELLPQVSGMNFSFDNGQPAGSKVKWITVNNNPIDIEAEYSVTSDEYLVTALQQLFGIPISDTSYVDSLTEFLALYEYVTTHWLTSVEKIKSLPENYNLQQNYPNPFNPCTTIEFSIPVRQNVSLKIYNSLGQEVGTLINEELNAGVYKYNWTPKNLSSGIYFYKLNAGKFSEAMKLILIK